MHMRQLISVATFLGIALTPIAQASAQLVQAAELSVPQQLEQLPPDFRDHFFDVPLALRVERDKQFLGDALVVLSRSGTVELLEFTEAEGSTFSADERERWAARLSEPVALGTCEQSCDDLIALHYSLENSVLSIATRLAEQTDAGSQYHALPENGSHGAILHNYLNIIGGKDQPTVGRYSVDAKSSIGKWTTETSFLAAQSADTRGTRQYSIPYLHTQREFEGHFVRAGVFVPSTQNGIRPPRTPGGLSATTMGVMAGTSDTLEVGGAKPSLYPVYVTANRDSIAEVYRNGVLLYSQPVASGLQLIDTRSLPGGVYDVEIRLVQDGNVISTQNELIYKPGNWSNLERRWRYTMFAGQQRSLLNGIDNTETGDWAFGSMVNYLAHPRVIVGASVQKLGDDRAIGASIDWQAAEKMSVYSSAYHSSRHGVGIDAQAMLRHKQSSAVISHNRSWQYADEKLGTAAGQVQNSALSLNHSINQKTNASIRATHNRGVVSGSGLDLSVSQQRKLWGSDALLRLSAFNRPAGTFNKTRNSGVEFGITLALGKENRQYSAAVGTRTGTNGQRDQYASAGIQQTLKNDYVSSVGANVNADRYGVGLGANALLQHKLARGDVFMQRSSLNNNITGGVNLHNSIAIGGGAVAMTGGDDMLGTDTGMIVDVESDDADIKLQAHDSRGRTSALKSGRNFIPVSSYRTGAIQFDFENGHAPSASMMPVMATYHLNKGGVSYQKVSVMKTVTVMGRLVDAQGNPLKGAHVINHAGRSVTEASGFFTLEMSERTPTISVRHAGKNQCELSLNNGNYEREGDTLLVGDLQCVNPAVVQQDSKPINQG